MFTKIVDFFSLMIFSTATVVNDLPVKVFNANNYPYDSIDKNFNDLTNLNNNVFEKPVYFLWDLSTFLQRWDLWITVSNLNQNIFFNVYEFPDCSVGTNASTYSNVFVKQISVDVFQLLSNKYRLAYEFSDRILSLGSNDSYSVSIVSLIDYYREKGDLSYVDFFYKFLNSFIDYNCKSGIAINVASSDNSPYVYLVPKWNNLSGINLRYFYLSQYHQFPSKENVLSLALLSVDLKGRYFKNNMMVYPVISGSSYVDIQFPYLVNDYYSSKYINLFTTGLSTSFSYNTIVIKFPTDDGNVASTDSPVIRFMNFSMLDATIITGWSSEGNPSGWALFDEVASTSCVWYDAFCHITSAVKWVMNNIIGFQQLYKLVNLFFTPMTLTLKTFKQYNVWFGDLPLISPVIVSGAMLLVLFNFYKRFK